MKKELLYVYNLKDELLCILNADDEYPAKNIQVEKQINSVWTLSFKIFRNSPKMKFIINENIIRYKSENYYIKSPSLDKTDNMGNVNVTCRHVSSSLEKQLNDEIVLVGVDATTMMTAVLIGSGWSLGTCTVDLKYRPLQSKDNTRFSNLLAIAETFDGMLQFHTDTHTVDLIKGLPDRQIYIRNRKNLKGINLTYNTDEIVTKLYVRGGDSDTGSGEISIVDIASENDTETGTVHELGKSYMYNYKWYLDMGYTQDYINLHPEKFLHEQILSLTEYKDSQALYDEAKKRLIIASKPKMTCSISMLDFSKYPEYCGELITKQPMIGEVIWVIDDDINEIVKAIVSSVSESDDNPMDLKVTLVNAIEYSSLMQQLIDSAMKVKTGFDSLGYQRGSYIKGKLDLLEVQLNSTQSNYMGVNSDANGNLFIENITRTGAIKLGGSILGLGSRTVAERDAGIDYHYRAFGTPDGFTADEIVAGILKGGKWYANLEDGTFLIGNSPTDYKLYFDGTQLNIKMASGQTLEEKFTSTQTQITANNTAIALKADITTTNGLNSRLQSAEQVITPTGITNKFTESLNGGTTVQTGIVKYNKDGIEVSNSTANTKTKMEAIGFSVVNNSDDSPIQQVKDSGIQGTILTIQDIKQNASAPFMIKVQNGLLNLYVDVTSGDDTRTGTSWTQSVKTINAALSKIPKFLNGSQVNIYVKGGYDGYSTNQDVIIQGFTGSGNLVIYLDHGIVINGILRVLECTVPIIINGSSFAITQGHTAWRRSGFYITSDTFCCLVDACSYFYALDIAFIQKSIGVGQGVMSHYGSDVYLEGLEISNMWCALNASDMGRLSYESLIGTNNTYGHYVYRGGLVQFPEGDSRATMPNNINGSMITIGSGGRTIGTTPNVQNGTIIMPNYVAPTYTPYERISEWGASSSFSWRDSLGYRNDNSYMYSGEWSGNGNNRGFGIMDYTGIRNALSGATINWVQIYLYRINTSHGYASSQSTNLYSHGNEYKTGYGLGNAIGSISLNRGEGQWITVSNQLAYDIQNGSTGFAIGNGAYIICENPIIKISYTK